MNGYINVTKSRIQNKENYQREGHYVMIKESIYQEDTAILNVYAPKKHASKYVKQ